jgi:hypothetical protein
MSTDFLLREQFVTNPAQILSEYVQGKAPSPQKAAVANQLVYAVMAHPRLLAWLRDYAARNRRHPPSRDRAVSDFSRAVVDLGACHVVVALVRSSVEREPIDFEEAWAVLFGGGGAVNGVHGAHEANGSIAQGTHENGAAIEHVAATAGTSGGTGTTISHMAATAGTSGGTGTTISHMAATAGTSGGTGTTISHMAAVAGPTGNGTTEMSGMGIFDSAYASVTLEALAQYSAQLLAMGALDTIHEA